MNKNKNIFIIISFRIFLFIIYLFKQNLSICFLGICMLCWWNIYIFFNATPIYFTSIARDTEEIFILKVSVFSDKSDLFFLFGIISICCRLKWKEKNCFICLKNNLVIYRGYYKIMVARWSIVSVSSIYYVRVIKSLVRSMDIFQWPISSSMLRHNIWQ